LCATAAAACPTDESLMPCSVRPDDAAEHPLSYGAIGLRAAPRIHSSRMSAAPCTGRRSGFAARRRAPRGMRQRSAPEPASGPPSLRPARSAPPLWIPTRRASTRRHRRS
jgi:hypothetical protein